MTSRVDRKTLQAQADATNPAGSAWVSANAGSGKTYVLSRRVIRLLLSGVNPSRILCLTFTKAAAAEMAKRVFAILSEWTTLPDSKLSREVAELEGQTPDSTKLSVARRLFARALETPGGLKIQTIHAFCERLLHQFPFEANVAGHFEVLDERTAAALAEAARRSVLGSEKAEYRQALDTVLAAAGDLTIEAAIGEFVARRDLVRAWIVAAGSLDRALDRLRAALGPAPNETVDSLRLSVVEESAFTPADITRLLELLEASDKTSDQAAAARLAPYRSADPESRISAFLAFFRTGTGALRQPSGIVTKSIKSAWPGLAETLESERDRLEALLDRIAAAECFEASAAMLRLVDAVIAEYERLKRLRGALDFEDLIVKTANLLSRADAARWVQYKLDRGLDHVLVDEAQDTSPRQWGVIKALAEEFFAGEGAGPAARTLFAVGDEKQSIFSFQGAVPAWFARTQRELGTRAHAGGFAWKNVALHLSFRSTPTVLSAVDAVFDLPAARAGVTSGDDWPLHEAFRRNDPGRVTVWPMIEPPPRSEPSDWTTPLDRLDDKSPEIQLADRISATIGGWLEKGERLPAGAGPIRPRDILILCRTRGAQTDAINRALKTRGVPIAGADRLALTEHIAVLDLMALAQVMLLPEDDLSLAAVLKSPLIGLDEDALFRLSHGRSGSLWDALVEAREDAPKHALETLEAWRSRADYLDPHGFFARILGPDGGRRRFMRRLGQEAEDVLDEFLAQALAFEESNIPSLQGFLDWLTAAPTEIKRDTEMLRDEVRVMTVHGAKGLEADIVFLVDTGAAPVHASHDPRVVALDGDDEAVVPLVWMRGYKAMPSLVRGVVDEIREKSRQEYRRLLYVAMTRARDRLIVCGTQKRGTDGGTGWHALVRTALESDCRRIEAPDGSLEALEWGEAADVARPATLPPEGAPATEPPDWLRRPTPPAVSEVPRVTPSTVLASNDDTGFPPERLVEAQRNPEAAAALARGRIVHRLLQSLPDHPPEQRQAVAEGFLAATLPDWPEADRTALLGEVMGVVSDVRFAPLFAPGSRAEVEIAGTIDFGGPARISGRIDRLAVTDDHVLLVDYKTNRPAPETLSDVPMAYVAQLALYRRVLQRLYPGRAVTAAILWTDRPSLMEIPAEMLDTSLAAASRG